MKIRYLGLEEELLYEGQADGFTPVPGQMVWLDEVFYVDTVIVYPTENMVRVYLTDEKALVKKPVADSGNSTVQLENAVHNAQKSANSAIKESASLRRQVASVRQKVLHQQGKKDKP